MPEHLVNIGEVIVHGIVFDPKNGERLRTMDLNELFTSVPQLFDLLEERHVDYVLVGGVAMLTYIDGRNTQDIDLILARDDLEKLPEITIEHDRPDFARAWLKDLRVDFLFTNNSLFEKVRREFVEEREFVDRKIPCASTEGLILLKLFALPSLYRQYRLDRVRTYEKDIADLIERYAPSLEPLLAELAKHMQPSDVVELRKIVEEICGRIAKSRQRFSNDDGE